LLEGFVRKYLRGHKTTRLSPVTAKIADAQKWLKQVRTSLDGIIAKRRDVPYESGNRHGMQRIKNYRYQPTALSAVFATTKAGIQSARFYSVYTMSVACSITSVSHPRSGAMRKKRSQQSLKN
jgi:ATP-dependent DNA ligase